MPNLPTILLVDDDDSLRRVVEYQLTDAGFSVTSCASGEEALDRLQERGFRVALTDLVMPGISGIELLDRLRVLRPDTGVIVITAHADVATAVRAMQLGALDFLEKPFTSERLLVAVKRALEFVELRDENRRLRAIVQEHGEFENILGSSPALRRVLADLELAAGTDATVLILGESGTGKELAARAIHLNSRRRNGPFVVVNCGAIPENLIESELFGHKKGSFTGATEDRKGKFETASGGTLFLDEVAELPLSTQPRLLRALQEGEVDKIGAQRPVQVDVRVIAATNRELEETVAEGAFRDDLYYRLNVIPLAMPPLRERRQDIPLLVEHFLVKHARRHGRPLPRLEPEALDRLERYEWPGNVRELENVVEQAVVLCRGDTVEVGDLPEEITGDRGPQDVLRIPVGNTLADAERELILETLRKAGGNKTQAAKMLGIGVRTLYRKLEEYGQA